MRLVKHPATNLPLPNGTSKCLVTKLLRRYQQDTDIPHLDLFQYIGPLRHGEQTIQCSCRLNTFGQQAIDLIFHQGLQRRNNHRHAAVAVIAVQRRQLIAKRLAATRCQNSQHMLTLHAGQNNIVLQALSRSFVAKIGKAKVPFELPAWIMGFTTVAARFSCTGYITQLTEQLSSSWKLITHPGCQYRIAA